MKKFLLLFFMFVLAMTAMAQRTQKITYQAVVRDAANRLVVYTPVRVDVTITSSTGSYFESLRDTTNANGLMSVEIGGNPGFEDIDWVEAVIKTVITINGGETVTDEVTVTAVPFALQASYATNVSPTAPTIVAVYNQIQADSLALANQIAAERAHLDDTLSHYLMEEVQVLRISNDTIYLTGGSFVKLPAGFSGDYNDLVNKPTNVSAFNNDAGYLTSDSAVIVNLNTNVTNLQGDVTNLQGDVTNLQNADNALSSRITTDSTNLANNYYNKTDLNDTLRRYATLKTLNDTLSHYLMQEVQALRISNDTIYLTGGSFVKLPAGFSGDYNDLTHRPDLSVYATNVRLTTDSAALHDALIDTASHIRAAIPTVPTNVS
ncbi:MAG: hypothetical protein J6P65_02260, partial [Bacteroidales bacterium]|nr:hypothetical protein [Bacteroidales bacterium]